MSGRRNLQAMKTSSIIFFIIAVGTCMYCIYNVRNIVKINYKPITSDVAVYAGCPRLWDDLSYNERRSVIEEVETKFPFTNGLNGLEFIEEYYTNRLYIKVFGKKSYLETGDGIYAYRYRERRLKRKFQAKIAKVYAQWKAEYTKYKELSTKELEERISLNRELFPLTLLFSVTIYMLSLRKLGSKNGYAKKLGILNIVCFVVATIAMLIWSWIHPLRSDTFYVLAMAYIPTLLISILQIRFLSARSIEENSDSFLIPQGIIKVFKIKSNFKKRLLMVLVCYPLFVLVPIPAVGLGVLLFYIIPMVLIWLLIWSIMFTINWVKKGILIDKSEK